MDSWIGGRTLYGASRWPRIAWIKRFLQHDGYLSETSVADFEAAGFGASITVLPIAKNSSIAA
jgi:hypothetical protein